MANIGNSGYIIIRDGMIYKRSSPMVHEFNFPVLMEGGDTPSELMEVIYAELDVPQCHNWNSEICAIFSVLENKSFLEFSCFSFIYRKIKGREIDGEMKH